MHVCPVTWEPLARKQDPFAQCRPWHESGHAQLTFGGPHLFQEEQVHSAEWIESRNWSNVHIEMASLFNLQDTSNPSVLSGSINQLHIQKSFQFGISMQRLVEIHA